MTDEIRGAAGAGRSRLDETDRDERVGDKKPLTPAAARREQGRAAEAR